MVHVFFKVTFKFVYELAHMNKKPDVFSSNGIRSQLEIVTFVSCARFSDTHCSLSWVNSCLAWALKPCFCNSEVERKDFTGRDSLSYTGGKIWSSCVCLEGGSKLFYVLAPSTITSFGLWMYHSIIMCSRDHLCGFCDKQSEKISGLWQMNLSSRLQISSAKSESTKPTFACFADMNSCFLAFECERIEVQDQSEKLDDAKDRTPIKHTVNGRARPGNQREQKLLV